MTSTTKPFEQQLELQFEWQVERHWAPDRRPHNGQSYEELCGE
jgi:hypothetical protein